MSPELIDPQRFGFKNSRPTESSDCYALGMVIYETICGKIPFHQDGDLTVFVKVLEGKHPLRGKGFTESLWRMLGLCWASQPNDRPCIEDVFWCLASDTHSPRAGHRVIQVTGDNRPHGPVVVMGVPVHVDPRHTYPPAISSPPVAHGTMDIVPPEPAPAVEAVRHLARAIIDCRLSSDLILVC